VTRGYNRHQAGVVTAGSGGVTIFNAELTNPSLFLFFCFTNGEQYYWSERAISEIEQAALLVAEVVITNIELNGGLM
jgi:hypothetical protein